MRRMLPVLFVLGLIILTMGLLVSGGQNSKKEKNSNLAEVKAVVLTVDDSEVIKAGISQIGFQQLTIKINSGSYRGQETTAVNQLVGKMELDDYYQPGDKIVAAIATEGGQIQHAKALSLYRQDWQLAMFGLFVVCLLIFARFVGLKALFSFIASLYITWNFLIPGLLEGKNPLLWTALFLILIIGIIIFAVAGFTKKGLAAFIGTLGGLLLTIAITLFFGDKMVMDGMNAPFAETLLFSGHFNLNMLHIFYAAIVIGASGAAMDVAIDVAASMEEIKLKKPEIAMGELVQSGFNVGRAVIGTMTTTLLLAYSGGYLTLLMLFMSKDSSFVRILNLKMVAAEIMRTVVGSTGLVLVAPLTAVVAGWIYCTDFRKFLTKFSRQAKEI